MFRCRIGLGVALLFASSSSYLAAQAARAPSQKATAKTASDRDGETSGEQRAARYLEAVRKQPSLLFEFLRHMPKGGDLHNHLTGAVYAESYIQFAASDGLCVDRKMLVLSPAPCDDARPPAARALTDGVLYREMIDAFSMRHFSGAMQSGHDHFFDSFGKFGAVSRSHTGAWLAEVVSRAANQNVEYLELILNLERGRGLSLGTQLGWDDDFDRFRAKVDANGAAEIVAASRKFLDETEAEMKRGMRCDTTASSSEGTSRGPDAGCSTTVRYIYEVYRGLSKEQVFAQMQIGFELANADPRVVGINPVMPEDGYTSMHDFDLHMRMFDYFHKLYPKVHLTLHAGELTSGLVPPDRGLGDHIRKSIEQAHAERIGHGVDVMYETDALGLLREMAQRKIMVEICLTSHDQILGVRGDRHPLPMYMKFGVPVALATDDEGVSRSNITQEYQRAVETYGLSYLDLKRFARTAVEHSFADDATKRKVRERLEQDFAGFERECCTVKP